MAALFENFWSANPKQYSQKGYELTQTLVRQLKLSGWANGQPETTDTDERYLDEVMDGFIEGSNADARRQGAESQSYHPEYWGYIQRAITDCALRMEASENPDLEHSLERASTCLKAWAVGLNPWAMLSVAAYLHLAGEDKYAKQALDVCSMYQGYWTTRPEKEMQFVVRSYMCVRVYVPRYEQLGLMDMGESQFPEKLANDIEAVRSKL